MAPSCFLDGKNFCHLYIFIFIIFNSSSDFTLVYWVIITGGLGKSFLLHITPFSFIPPQSCVTLITGAQFNRVLLILFLFSLNPYITIFLQFFDTLSIHLITSLLHYNQFTFLWWLLNINATSSMSVTRFCLLLTGLLKKDHYFLLYYFFLLQTFTNPCRCLNHNICPYYRSPDSFKLSKLA